MLHPKCKHSKALPIECCTLCNETPPPSLLDLCLDNIINNLDTVCEFEPGSQYLRLKPHITLPVEISEKLLNARLNKGLQLDSQFMYLFSNVKTTRLKRVKLRNTDVDDAGMKVLLHHRLMELELSSNRALTANTLRNITAFGGELISLTLIDSLELFPTPTFGYAQFDLNHIDKGYIVLAPKLRKLCIRGLLNLHPLFYRILLKPLERLTHLDLSSCSDLGDLNYIEHLNNLMSLTLYNVNKLDLMMENICKLKGLRHLDVSQSKDEHFRYENPNTLLSYVVENLPKLNSLDISGTNLAGTGVAEPTEMGDNKSKSDIPGLATRVNNPLHFLGLYETENDACLRHDIPANLVR